MYQNAVQILVFYLNISIFFLIVYLMVYLKMQYTAKD